MTRRHLLSPLVLGLALALGAPSARAASASAQLQALDKATYSGDVSVSVDLYDPPKKDGRHGTPARYRATLLFERPDRFRLVLRPGDKDEFRAVAEAGIVRWYDKATGLSGKDEAAKVTDPIALALLGSAGELLRFTSVREVALPKGAKLAGARLVQKTWGSGLQSGMAWFGSDGRATGFEFVMVDGTKVFVSVLAFKQNVQTTPGDFTL